jgi:hypothetical protein
VPRLQAGREEVFSNLQVRRHIEHKQINYTQSTLVVELGLCQFQSSTKTPVTAPLLRPIWPTDYRLDPAPSLVSRLCRLVRRAHLRRDPLVPEMLGIKRVATRLLNDEDSLLFTDHANC